MIATLILAAAVSGQTFVEHGVAQMSGPAIVVQHPIAVASQPTPNGSIIFYAPQQSSQCFVAPHPQGGISITLVITVYYLDQNGDISDKAINRFQGRAPPGAGTAQLRFQGPYPGLYKTVRVR